MLSFLSWILRNTWPLKLDSRFVSDKVMLLTGLLRQDRCLAMSSSPRPPSSSYQRLTVP